jgi:hypothetical protein
MRSIWILLALGCGASVKAPAWPRTGNLAGWSCFEATSDGAPVATCFDTADQCEESKMDGSTCRFTREAACFVAGDAMDCSLTNAACQQQRRDTAAEKPCEMRSKPDHFTCWSGKDADGKPASNCSLFVEECASDQKEAADNGVTITEACAPHGQAYCAGDVMDTCSATMNDCQAVRKDDDPPCGVMPPR